MRLSLAVRHTIEAFPDAFLFFDRQPWPLIAHGYICCASFYREGHRHWLVGRRVVEGIIQIVRHYLDKAVCVGMDQNLFLSRQVKAYSAHLVYLALILDCFLNDTYKVTGNKMQAERLRLNA